MITRLIKIVFLLNMLTSCTANHFITVRENGSAIVDIDRDYSIAELNKYYQSNVISNIDTNVCFASRVKFEISNIDSLGKYLPFHTPDFFWFRMVGDTLIVSDGHTNAFKYEDLFCCAVSMLIKFDKDIQNFESANSIARKKDKNTVLIMKSRKQLIKGKKKLDVKIIIK